MYLYGTLKNKQIVKIDEYEKEMGEIFCPAGHKLYPKKGGIKIHHFAHFSGQKCDPWRQGMTNWHSTWQEIVKDKNNLEVIMEREGNIHIADIFNSVTNTDIEIQHSPISQKNIQEREKFYKKMIWIFDWTPSPCSQKESNKTIIYDGKVIYMKEKVKILFHFSKYILISTRTKYWFQTNSPTYFDIGTGIVRVIGQSKKKPSIYLCKFKINNTICFMKERTRTKKYAFCRT